MFTSVINQRKTYLLKEAIVGTVKEAFNWRNPSQTLFFDGVDITIFCLVQ